MNKTIIININGMVFHIEEDAYEVLKSYMTEIKRHFSYSADCDEIITDIENRLAEMFNELLAEQSKQVIILQDVEEITAKMGSVNDFDYTAEDTPKAKVEKRLFRDTDDKTIGGVCSGLAHYLHLDVKAVRIVTIILSIFTGIGLVLYAILWIAVPEAKTRQEKMAMRGEPINLQNFKKNAESSSEAPYQRNRSDFQTGDFIENALKSIISFAATVFGIVIKSLGFVVVIAGAALLTGLLAMLIFAVGFLSEAELNIWGLNAINPEYRSSIYFSAFILIIIPLIALVSLAIRVVFNYRMISRTGAFAMLVLWLTGLGMGIYNGSRIAAEFKEEAGFEQQTSIDPYKTYHLKINRNRHLTHNDSTELKLDKGRFEGRILIDNDDNFSEIDFTLSIEKSDLFGPVIVKEFRASGKTVESALANARNTSYHITQQDSVLLFDKHLRLADHALLRNQKLNMILKIPTGTMLLIDRNFAWRIRNFNAWDCNHEDTNEKTPFRVLMTENGLKCADGPNEVELNMLQ